MHKDDKTTMINSIINSRKNRLASHIYLIYWDIHRWAARKWAEDGWSDITSDHLKLISLLAAGGKFSNNDLAKQAGVTKQAMSQMVTLLEKRGVLNVEQNPKDSRAKLISLSDYGFEFLAYLGLSTDKLMKEYTEIIGEDKMKTITEISRELGDGLIKINRD